jgi:hypothetical protein
MTKGWIAALTGGFVLAALMLPAVADEWTNGQARSFNVRSISVHDIVGNVSVAVRDNGPITVQVSGLKDRVNAVSVSQEDGKVEVSGENYHDVWDWRHWFDFSEHTSTTSDLSVKVTVPRGSDVRVEELIGDAQIGDTMGPLHFGAISTKSTIGRVGEAHISLAGSGDVKIADIAGDLHAETAGSGKIVTGNVKSVHADVAGAGSIATGRIDGDLHLDIAGSGDFAAPSLNGGVHVSIAGSGSVRIAQGTADPFNVDILGSGNIFFGGTAIDPHVDGFGSGSVSLHAMKGSLHNDGMANVRIGS